MGAVFLLNDIIDAILTSIIEGIIMVKNIKSIISGIGAFLIGEWIYHVLSQAPNINPDYSCTKFLTTAKSVKYNKSP